jgi:tripartite-type tricarboxylate transporter receptor subunit TctC
MKIVCVIVAAVLSAIGIPPAIAQPYPSKPIKIIVPIQARLPAEGARVE